MQKQERLTPHSAERFHRGDPEGRLADQSTVGTELSGNLVKGGGGIGMMDTNWACFDLFLRKGGAQVEDHLTAFILFIYFLPDCL